MCKSMKQRQQKARHPLLIAFISPKSCVVAEGADLFSVTQQTEPRSGHTSFFEAVWVYEEEEFSTSWLDHLLC